MSVKKKRKELKQKVRRIGQPRPRIKYGSRVEVAATKSWRNDPPAPDEPNLPSALRPMRARSV